MPEPEDLRHLLHEAVDPFVGPAIGEARRLEDFDLGGERSDDRIEVAGKEKPIELRDGLSILLRAHASSPRPVRIDPITG